MSDEITPVYASGDEGEDGGAQCGSPDRGGSAGAGASSADWATEKKERRRRQNTEAARRSRAKRKEEHRQIFARFYEQAAKIAELEERVRALVAVLEDAGITVPPGGLAEQAVAAASAAVRGAASSAAADAAADDDEDDDDDDGPDAEALFHEMLDILEGSATQDAQSE